MKGFHIMVRELVHDPILLAKKSAEAGVQDLQDAVDLMDTLVFHKEECVGMAANMIGVYKKIIVFLDGDTYRTMFNPEIIRAQDPFEGEEGCLSLQGGPRKVKRFQKIKVRYQNEKMQVRLQSFNGFTAQIIQHEVDHCNGILI